MNNYYSRAGAKPRARILIQSGDLKLHLGIVAEQFEILSFYACRGRLAVVGRHWMVFTSMLSLCLY